MTNPIAPPPGKSIEIPITVRFGDTDPYGVVYFASYFRYCHQGIEEFFRHLGLAPQEIFRNTEEGFGLPIVEASCSFHKPVRYGESLRLAVYIMQARSKVLTFGFYFYPSEGDALIAHGEATLVAIDRSWQSRSLPDELRQVLQPYVPPLQHS